ncbi:MAG: T9SS type A sorting domain-containing protein [Candidatus Latescibacteria bacterium]|nr:T9SS type A sorting domain-containing protein [Candidatus Latescibacterota bacterium]
MIRKWIDRRIPLLAAAVALLFSAPIASAQVEMVEIFPLPGGHEWSAILGAANMDLDPADEIVIVDRDQQLLIVDSETGEIQFDSGPYDWNAVRAPGWTSSSNNNHGYDIFCDEDGDGIYCANVLVSDISEYEYKLAVICPDRNPTAAPDAEDSSSQFDLRPGYPNPASTSTRIDFHLAEAARASVRVFDAQGRSIRTLLDEELAAGEHSVVWDGRNGAGREVASGTYYYELEMEGRRITRKSLILR